MISVKMPTSVILLKIPQLHREDKFVFTYEYGWFEFKSSSNSKEIDAQQVTDANLYMPADCSWDNIVLRFPVNQQSGVTS